MGEAALGELLELVTLQQRVSQALPSGGGGNWALLLKRQEQRVRLCVQLLAAAQTDVAQSVMKICALDPVEVYVQAVYTVASQTATIQPVRCISPRPAASVASSARRVARRSDSV